MRSIAAVLVVLSCVFAHAGEEPPSSEGTTLLERGRAAIAAKQYAEARGHLKAAVAHFKEAGDAEGLAEACALGATAALRMDALEEAWAFLEAGRAGSLLATLDVRRALPDVVLPAELRRAEMEALTRVAEAHVAVLEARRTGVLQRMLRARRELEAARTELLAVIEREERFVKRSAGLVHPRADSLSEVQARLQDGTALVLYAFLGKQATALVVGRASARAVTLGPVDKLRAAIDALGVLVPDREATAELAALRALLIDPLELDAATHRLLVSPAGLLAFVPFGAIVGERSVAFVPSGTARALARSEGRSVGEGVLGVGDPDYSRGHGQVATPPGGRRLPPLPATRAEVEAVGTKALLGAHATEAGVRTALAARPRWRAVHFACHTLIDPRRPLLSSLALTAEGKDDGFLTALEVLRLDVPADLVVLAGAETGRGRVYEGEGLVGLPGAFLQAGAGGVLASLCNVDDEATRALMVKFYGLWIPRSEQSESEGHAGEGLPAAEALRQAQAHVRSHEAWEHPYYWAAWVIWGLPD